MKNEKVILANGTEVLVELNRVVCYADNQKLIEHELEPRQMQVLQILMENSPRVVERNHFIEKVWHNYGGADDALNQVISHLRKVIGDTNPENRIIQTVSKKGYRIIGSKESDLGVENKTDALQLTKFRMAIILLIAAMVIYAIVRFTSESKAPPAPGKADQKSTDSPAPKNP